ncbi:MAG: hypothetical protein JSW11_11100 [Candidatus Heimdallarchaeota archaeon]|nr:MAG: hypothetical protein JSW11_11100 [Candidatus Heimdallarchaeota archaeon]
MSKTQRHRSELQLIFTEFFQTNDDKKLTEYLLSNSNLPGRRANLELARAFTIVVNDNWKDHKDFLWKLLISLINIDPIQAPTNNPQEFLSFCATWALGTIGASSEIQYIDALSHLKELSTDSRWRIREAVAKGIHELISLRSIETIKEIDTWISKDHWLSMRAVVTGVAAPTLLQDNQIAKQALNLHKKVLTQVETCKDRKSEEFKVLRKGLAYSLSVVVQAIPEEGFKYLKELATSQDNDISWILKENLKKNRLVKNFPSKVKEITRLLQ